MKYLGIDFGLKKIGVALSDERGKIAFPHAVLENDGRLLLSLNDLINAHGVEMIAVGDTKTAAGDENEITPALDAFVTALQQNSGKKIVLVPEYGTTGAARAGLGENEARGKIQSPRKSPQRPVDARAAALILQRCLDTNTL